MGREDSSTYVYMFSVEASGLPLFAIRIRRALIDKEGNLGEGGAPYLSYDKMWWNLIEFYYSKETRKVQ